VNNDASVALTDLARRLIEQSGSAASAAANLIAIRSEVERVGRTVAAQPEKQAQLAADLQTALIAAGLGDLAPPAAPLVSLQAALLRLERHLAALAAVHVLRKGSVAGA
jgi:hypothetical protein